MVRLIATLILTAIIGGCADRQLSLMSPTFAPKITVIVFPAAAPSDPAALPPVCEDPAR